MKISYIVIEISKNREHLLQLYTFVPIKTLIQFRKNFYYYKITKATDTHHKNDFKMSIKTYITIAEEKNKKKNYIEITRKKKLKFYNLNSFSCFVFIFKFLLEFIFLFLSIIYFTFCLIMACYIFYFLKLDF